MVKSHENRRSCGVSELFLQKEWKHGKKLNQRLAGRREQDETRACGRVNF